MPVAKKNARKITKTFKSRTAKSKIIPVVPELSSLNSRSKLLKFSSLNPRLFTFLLVIVVIALVVVKYGSWFVPAMIDNKPITRFTVWKKLENIYGKQTLDDLVNGMILDKAIINSGVTIEQAKLDEQLASIRKQFESQDKLDEALKQRGMTQADFEKIIRTQLTVEEILKDKAEVTEDEIKENYDNNANSLYKDSKFAEVKDQIAAKLKDSKLSEAYNAWFAEAKKSIPVKNFGL